MTTRKIHPGDVYAKFRKGDYMTNGELLVAMEHYKTLADLLVVSGDPFHLPFCEANRLYLAFADFAQNRNLI